MIVVCVMTVCLTVLCISLVSLYGLKAYFGVKAKELALHFPENQAASKKEVAEVAKKLALLEAKYDGNLSEIDKKVANVITLTGNRQIFKR